MNAPLSFDESRRAQKLLHAETALATLQIQLLAGLGYVAFYTRGLHATDQQVGLLAAVPSLTQLLQLIIAPRTAGMRHGKMLVLASGAVSGMLLSAGALMIHTLPADHRVLALVLLVGASNAVAALGQPLFNAWFANLLPHHGSANYLATRFIVQSTIALAATYLMGLLLARAPGDSAYTVIFILGGVATVAGRAILWRTPDAILSGEEVGKTRWHAALTVPFQYRGFIAFTGFYLVWVVAAFLSAPFQQVFLMRRLAIPLDRIGLLTAITTLFTLLTFRFWGVMADRHSNKAVFLTGFAGLATVQAAYLLAAPGRYGILYPMAVLAGVCSSAAGLTVNNLFYRVCPKNSDKVVLFGFYAAVIGLATFLGPILGGAAATALTPVVFHVSLLTFDNYRLLFLGTAALWLLTVPLLRLVPEEAPVSVRALVRDLGPAGAAARRREREDAAPLSPPN